MLRPNRFSLLRPQLTAAGRPANDAPVRVHGAQPAPVSPHLYLNTLPMTSIALIELAPTTGGPIGGFVPKPLPRSSTTESKASHVSRRGAAAGDATGADPERRRAHDDAVGVEDVPEHLASLASGSARPPNAIVPVGQSPTAPEGWRPDR